MKTQRCQGLKCALICAWLWISGLLLMGKIMSSLGQFAPNLNEVIRNTDTVGTLQVFFLFYTAVCVALYFLWRRVSLLNHAAPPAGAASRGSH